MGCENLDATSLSCWRSTLSDTELVKIVMKIGAQLITEAKIWAPLFSVRHFNCFSEITGKMKNYFSFT